MSSCVAAGHAAAWYRHRAHAIIIKVPYHIDDYLPELDLPLHAAQVITEDLPPGDAWGRLAVLYRRVAEAVADAARHGSCPVGKPPVGEPRCSRARPADAGARPQNHRPQHV